RSAGRNSLRAWALRDQAGVAHVTAVAARRRFALVAEVAQQLFAPTGVRLDESPDRPVLLPADLLALTRGGERQPPCRRVVVLVEAADEPVGRRRRRTQHPGTNEVSRDRACPLRVVVDLRELHVDPALPEVGGPPQPLHRGVDRLGP